MLSQWRDIKERIEKTNVYFKQYFQLTSSERTVLILRCIKTDIRSDPRLVHPQIK